MPGELLLVNPRHKRRKRRASSSRRRRRKITALRRNPRRSRRRMSALQMKYFGGGRKRRSGSRRRVTSMLSNPRRRRRSSSRRRKFSIFRRNPSPLDNPTSYVEPVIAGAAGGIALNYAFCNVQALANLSPMTQNIAKLVGAALLGWAAGKVAGERTGTLVATGAMTITAYDIINQYVPSSWGVGGGYGYGGYRGYGMGRYAMGRFVGMKGRPRLSRMKGYWNPARTGKMNGMARFVPR